MLEVYNILKNKKASKSWTIDINHTPQILKLMS